MSVKNAAVFLCMQQNPSVRNSVYRPVFIELCEWCCSAWVVSARVLLLLLLLFKSNRWAQSSPFPVRHFLSSLNCFYESAVIFVGQDDFRFCFSISPFCTEMQQVGHMSLEDSFVSLTVIFCQIWHSNGVAKSWRQIYCMIIVRKLAVWVWILSMRLSSWHCHHRAWSL